MRDTEINRFAVCVLTSSFLDSCAISAYDLTKYGHILSPLGIGRITVIFAMTTMVRLILNPVMSIMVFE